MVSLRNFQTTVFNYIVFSCLVIASNASDALKIVQTENGAVRGKLSYTLFDKTPFYSFLGIPYGKPPLNILRFKPPQVAEPWKGVLDTFTFGNNCIQKNGSEIEGSEDCLYLNVFTPAYSYKKLTVMVYIYGGGFNSGSPNCLGPDFLIERNVILVTMNYRLGPFGFLSLGTDEYSGNAALKDQVLALKWVNNNIAYFGGNKNSITLFGQSAGAISVSYHLLSSASKGLFHRAIIQSSTALTPGTLTKNPQMQYDALYEFANKFGNVSHNYTKLVNLLTTVNASLLLNQTYHPYLTYRSRSLNVKLFWTIVVEDETADQPFLTKAPQTIIIERTFQNVDTLFGFNSEEGFLLLASDAFNPDFLEPINKYFEITFPLECPLYNYSSKVYRRMAKDIRHYYFGSKAVDNATLLQLTTLVTDTDFIFGVYKAAIIESHRSSSTTFLYMNSMDTSLNGFKIATGMAKLGLPGVCHGDELFYIFRVTCSLTAGIFTDVYKNLAPDSIQRKLIRSTTTLWTNFAKYGTPTPNADPTDIKPIVGDTINYMYLTNNGVIAGINPRKNNMDFWNNFYEKYQNYFQYS